MGFKCLVPIDFSSSVPVDVSQQVRLSDKDLGGVGRRRSNLCQYSHCNKSAVWVCVCGCVYCVGMLSTVISLLVSALH